MKKRVFPHRNVQHLIAHCIVLVGLVAIGLVAVINDHVEVNRTWLFRLIPFGIALIGTCFGIWTALRYSGNIARGCEITVTTAEAKVFPYFFYFVSIVLATIQFLH
jgi:hypothetical protein